MIQRATTSLLSAAVLGAALTPALRPEELDKSEIVDVRSDIQQSSGGPILIDAKPERVGLVKTPDGVTQAIVLVRPVGVADSCRQTTCGAHRGDLWTSYSGPNYVALGEGQTFAENRSPEADQARQDAKASQEPTCSNCDNAVCTCKPLSQIVSYGSVGRAVATPAYYTIQQSGGCWGGVQTAYQPAWGSRRVVNVRPRFIDRRRTIRRVRQGTRAGLWRGVNVNT